jgi:hypothetical protein
MTRCELSAGAALAAWGLLGSDIRADDVRHWWRQRTPPPSPVAVVCTDNRGHGIQRAVALLGEKPVAGEDVLLIPDLESVRPYPFKLMAAGDSDSRRFADQLSEQLAYG